MDKRIERLIELLKIAMERAQQLLDLNRQFQEAAGRAKPEELVKIVREYGRKSEEGLGVQQASLKEALTLAQQLGSDAPPAGSGAVRAEDFAKHFRTLIDRMQLDARMPREGDVATTLKSLDVELKGMIVVEEDEARIITPSLSRVVDPGQLSTIRMSFGTIPVLPAASADQPEEPK